MNDPIAEEEEDQHDRQRGQADLEQDDAGSAGHREDHLVLKSSSCSRRTSAAKTGSRRHFHNPWRGIFKWAATARGFIPCAKRRAAASWRGDRDGEDGGFVLQIWGFGKPASTA